MTNSSLNIKNSKLILPDGTMVKLTDPSKLQSLGWKHKIELMEGIKKCTDGICKINNSKLIMLIYQNIKDKIVICK